MKKISRFIIHKSYFILLFVFILSTLNSQLSTLFAAPHISGKRIPGQPKDHIHRIPDVNRLRAKGLSPRAIQEAIGATGDKKVAVILVSFSGLGSDTWSTSPDISDFSGIRNYVSGLSNFYKEVSYGQLNLTFDFYPSSNSAYTLSQSMAHYGSDEERGDELIQHAISASASIKHKNAGGPYDAVIVVHAGYGNEVVGTTNTGDIWSAFYGPFTNTQGFTEGLTVPEMAPSGRSTFGVYCHEFGHQLGLPDLYNAISGDSQVGKWCLMDYGTWSGSTPGAEPSHPSAWCKQLLGWVSPEEISSLQANISLTSIETTTASCKIPILGSNEYFLLESRYRSSPTATYDKGLPGEGLLIWHIDDGVIYSSVTYDYITWTRLKHNLVNSRYPTSDVYLGVNLVEADSDDPSYDKGDNTDPWSGGADFISPKSDSNDGSPTGIGLIGITFSGGVSNATLVRRPWIRGWVRNSAGSGISGVTVTATGVSISTSVSAVSNPEGQYLILLATGTYTLTPAKTNYSFYPSSRTVHFTDNLDNQDFTGTPRTEVASRANFVLPENNVFNPAKGEKTTIWYQVNEAGKVKLQIYTFDGLLVRTLVEDYKNAGYYAEPWYGKNMDEETVASGIYLLYFEVNGTKQVKKIAIIK